MLESMSAFLSIKIELLRFVIISYFYVNRKQPNECFCLYALCGLVSLLFRAVLYWVRKQETEKDAYRCVRGKGGRIIMADYNEVLTKAMDEAKDFIDNPSKMDDLLLQCEDKLREVPAIGETVAEVPLMISLVKSWIKKEYAVSPKVLATMVGAFLYLVKKQDLISDKIPVLGIADDVAILGLALTFIAPDLEAYKKWKQGN